MPGYFPDGVREAASRWPELGTAGACRVANAQAGPTCRAAANVRRPQLAHIVRRNITGTVAQSLFTRSVLDPNSRTETRTGWMKKTWALGDVNLAARLTLGEFEFRVALIDQAVKVCR